MSYFDKVKLKRAVKAYNKFDLSSNHLTTTDFGQNNVVNCIDCVIGDKFKYGYHFFSRVAPMVFPTYGEVGMRVMSVFVPYYLIADDADAYISGLTYFNGTVATGRFLKQSDIDSLIWSNYYSTVTDSGYGWSGSSPYLTPFTGTAHEAASNPTIFTLKRRVTSSTVAGSHNEEKHFILTVKGKYIVKLLNSLGYQVNNLINITVDDEGHLYSKNSDLTLNAYPILCYFKAYVDLMLPNAFYNTSILIQFLMNVKHHDEEYVDDSGFINRSQLQSVLPQLAKVYYDSDYFTTAWQSPNSPLTNNMVSDLDLNRGLGNIGSVHVSNDANDNVLSLNNNKITATQLNFLRGFDNFVRRNNLVGFREYNAIYARFGIKPSEMKSNYVSVLDVRNLPMSVGDVTATSSSEDEPLGAYAGKGFMNSDASFSFECKDYGMFLQFAHIYVKPIYMQGIRKHCLRSECFDFYQPEFDGVGPMPISNVELNASVKNSIFGFSERYNEYRTQLDNVTGDFKFDPEMYPWHTARIFDPEDAPHSQSDNLLVYNLDRDGNSEYDRIFATENVDGTIPYDHFYQVWNFKVSAFRPMQNINQSLNLGEGDVVLDRNGTV